MKAIIARKYGPPTSLRLEDVEMPRIGHGEVLLEVHAASVNAADWHMQRANPFLVRFASGLFRPRHQIPGADVAGRVQAIGKDVSSLRPGDEVYGDLAASGWGAFAEFVAAPENVFAAKPVTLSFEQAAAVPLAGVTALQGLRDQARVKPGHKVVVNGASGGVGTFAVQLAKAFGAEVTAVCSTRNVPMARSLGADHVIDYTREDVTGNGQAYDVILDAAAFRPSSAYARSLNQTGTYVLVGGSTRSLFGVMIKGPWMSRKGGKRFKSFLARPRRADLQFLTGLIESGKVAPLIDRRYALRDVPEAMSYVEQGHTQGKVVINVAPPAA